ncbi:MAG: sensor histidine kinase [Ignavibacteriae bacterium]|nr:sensor histidine kinase [Ignavibacteriota bacterium]
MRKSSYRWIFIFILLFITVDFYFQLKISSVPFWESKWFLWRVLFLLVILFVLLIFKAYAHFRNIEIEKQNLVNKFIQQQDENYRRVASELHDSLGQNLIVLNNDITKILNSYPVESNEFEELNKINVLITEAVDELRNISSNLYPNKIEKLGLKKAIESMTENVFESSGIILNLSVGEIDRIYDNEIELNVFRIVQECINNILKHSKATEADINIHFNSGNLVAEISDNGIGFGAKKLSEKPGLGLDNINHRTFYCGGSIKINSKPNNGTKIKLVIPLKQ